MKRKQLSKKLRFKILSRDKFTCQYCGKQPPDVLLEVDHIQPVSKGGKNDNLNLITACKECNRGKGIELIDDDSAAKKQIEQLNELAEKREQLELLFKWKNELLKIEDKTINNLSNYWSQLLNDFYKLNENGIIALKRLLKKYTYPQIADAMQIAVNYYVKYKDGVPSPESVEIASKKVGGILYIKSKENEEPHLKDVYSICKVLDNRLSWYKKYEAIPILKEALEKGVPKKTLINFCYKVRRWDDYLKLLDDYVEAEQYE